MGIIVLSTMALVLSSVDNFLFIAATQHDILSNIPQANRTSKELKENSRMMHDPAIEFLKTRGRKSSADDYNTFSSLTSDVIIETSSNPANSKLFPSLTTSIPTFITRGRHIRNPFYFNKDDQEMEFEEESPTDFLLNSGVPKWNRYNNNHRQLNKYGQTPIEADITVDEDGSAAYGSTFDFNGGSGIGGGGGSSYDSGSYRNPGNSWAGGDGVVGWYNDPIPQSSRPVPIIAEIRHPSNQKMSIDFSKIGIFALVKIAIAKLKALGFIKAMLLVVFKLKLLILAVTIKFLMLIKFMKFAVFIPALFSLLTLPMLLSRIARLNELFGQMILVPNNLNNGGTAANNNDDNGNGQKRRINLDTLDDMEPGMSLFRKIIRSEKCVEKMSCRMASTKQPNLALIWINWAASPIIKYIPSKKIRTFVTTFTSVINYRLDNMYSNLLPNDWTKWCDDNYACNEAQHKKI